jgi:hypothetical protein
MCYLLAHWQMQFLGHFASPQEVEKLWQQHHCAYLPQPSSKTAVLLLGAAYPLVETRRIHRLGQSSGPGLTYRVVGYQNSLRTNGSHLLGPINELAVADALIATLQHESPYCVGGAAGIFCAIGGTPDGGQALLEASGAIPALVRVIERAAPPGPADKDTGMFHRYVLGHM